MIRSIKLTNFQSHKDTTLELDPGVNVIVGTSDSGKSAVIRALEWVRLNRPIGVDGWVFHGEDHMGVELELDDARVSRFKGKGANLYIVGNHTLAAVGSEVPEQVSPTLNLTDLNVQRQHDPPFMLRESAGSIARYLNEIAHLDVIDRATTAIKSMKRQNDQDIRSLEGQEAGLVEALEQFPDLESADAFISTLEGQQRESEEGRFKAVAIGNLIGRYVSLAQQIEQDQVADWVAGSVDELAEKVNRLESVRYTEEMLGQLSATHESLTAAIKEGSVPGHIRSRLAQVSDMASRAQDGRAKAMSMGMLLKQYEALEGKVSETDAIISQKEQELAELAACETICPLMDQPCPIPEVVRQMNDTGC